MLDISITIVAYHNYNDIKAAVESIQTYTDPAIHKKIYIVDNSCIPDGDTSKVEFLGFLSKWDQVEYVDTGANLGFGKGHNYVMDRLDSKYHAIVNPDILLLEDSFRKIMDYMEEENVGVVIPKLVDEEGEMVQAYRRELTLWDIFIRFCCPGMFKKRKAYHTMQDMDYTKPFAVPFAQGSFLVMKTELYRKIGGFDDRFFMYLEDADLCKRAREISSVWYYPYTEVVHKWERGSHKNFKLFRFHVQSVVRYFNKWGWFK